MRTGTKNGITSLLRYAVVLALTVSCSGEKTETEAVSASVSAPLYTEAAEARNYLISGDSVGNLQIGSTTTAVYQLFLKDRLRKETYQDEGMPYQALEIYHDTLNTPSLVLALNCQTTPCTVRKISIKDTAYHTKSGIRIGSTYGELKKAMKTGYVGWGETAFVAVSADIPVTFELDVKTSRESGTASVTAATLPDSAKVKGIFMFDPEPARSLEQSPEDQK